MWWCMPVISALGRQGPKDEEFKSSLSYMRPYLKKKEG